MKIQFGMSEFTNLKNPERDVRILRGSVIGVLSDNGAWEDVREIELL